MVDSPERLIELYSDGDCPREFKEPIAERFKEVLPKRFKGMNSLESLERIYFSCSRFSNLKDIFIVAVRKIMKK